MIGLASLRQTLLEKLARESIAVTRARFTANPVAATIIGENLNELLIKLLCDPALDATGNEADGEIERELRGVGLSLAELQAEIRRQLTTH